MAKVVAGPGGEVYLPIFERLERELAALDAKSDALARARFAARHYAQIFAIHSARCLIVAPLP